MKKKMVHIVNQLKMGEITTIEAKEEFLVLFGVSGSFNKCPVCEPDEIDILRCKNCDSIDIIGDHTNLRCSDCGTPFRGIC